MKHWALCKCCSICSAPPVPLSPQYALGRAPDSPTTASFLRYHQPLSHQGLAPTWPPPRSMHGSYTVATPVSRTNQTGPCKLVSTVSRFRLWVRSWIPRGYPEEQGDAIWKSREVHSPWGEVGSLKDRNWKESDMIVTPSLFLTSL